VQFKHKLLSCAIALALGCASGTVYPVDPTPNSKPFGLSGTTEHGFVKLAGSQSGQFLAVWEGYGQGKNVIYGRYTNQGSTVGDEIKIAESSDPTIYLSLWPGQKSVAMDPQGDAVVCWEAENLKTSSTQIFCRLIPKDSSFDIATPTISITTPRLVAGYSVAMDGSGNFIVAWINFDTNDVMARRFAADGTATGDEFVVSAHSAFGGQVSVAMDHDGDAIVAWLATNGIVARRIDKEGHMPKGGFIVDSTPGGLFTSSASTVYFVDNPSVAMDDAGNFAVAWERNRTDTKRDLKCHPATSQGQKYTECEYETSSVEATGIFAQRFDLNDNAINKNKWDQAREDIAIRFRKKQSHLYPDIAMDAAGDFVVSWQQKLANKKCFDEREEMYCAEVLIGHNIFARKYNRLKHRLEGAKIVVTKSKKLPYNTDSSVALLDGGSFEVGWAAVNDTGSAFERKASARFFPAKKK